MNVADKKYFCDRHYDPRIGRFLSQDPSGVTGSDGPNLYRYVRNNPINRVDPLGTDSVIVSQFGHEFIVIDDPSGNGGTIAFDFFPTNGRIEGLVNAVPGTVRRQSFGPGESPFTSFEVPFIRVSQDSAADQATINRALELQNAARSGDLKFNAFQARENTLNCAGFARAVQ